MRVPVDYRTSSRECYNSFKKAHPSIKISFEDWKNIIYAFNDEFRLYILETGEKAKLPSGIGEFSIDKKKRKKRKGKNDEFINLPIDWIKTREKGKIIYNFNYHTEGYFFGWKWFKLTARFKNSALWWFKPSRVTSRLLAHYLKTDENYQHIYREWGNSKSK